MNKKSYPIIEKVSNIQGSTAGAGSGEYHRYRSMRRKEKALEAALEKEKNDEFQKKLSDARKKVINSVFEVKTTRNRKKRELKKLRRKNKYKNNKSKDNDESESNLSICSTKSEKINEFDNKLVKLNNKNDKDETNLQISIKNSDVKVDNIVIKKENYVSKLSDKLNKFENSTNEIVKNNNTIVQTTEKIDENKVIVSNKPPHEYLILDNLNNYIKINKNSSNYDNSKNKLIINDLDN